MTTFDQQGQQIRSQTNIAHHQGAIGQIGDVISGETVNIRQELVARRTITRRQAARPPAGYVPRVEVEARLRALLTAPADALKEVYLTGLPRSGVSTLARHVAAELEEAFPDGTLWGDVQEAAHEDILWRFIEPYDQTLDRAALEGTKVYRETLGGLLRDKRVLIVLDHVQSPADVAALTPPDCPQVVMLVVSRVGLPGARDDSNWVHVPELTAAEAEQLFRTVWAGDPLLRETPPALLHELAQAHHFMPADMVISARHILATQVPPEDYLAELRGRSRAGDAAERPYAPVFGALFDRLPEQAQALLPYTGVLGRRWDQEALTAVAPLKRHAVEVGLRQLQTRLLVNREADGWYTTEPIIRDFALAKLRESGGAPLEWATRRVAAEHFLGLYEQLVDRHRRDIVDDYLQEALRQGTIAELSGAAFPALDAGADAGDPAGSAPGAGRPLTLSRLQERLEELAFREQANRERWDAVFLAPALQDLRQQLAQTLEWAVAQEDWPLVRLFARLGATPVDLSVSGDADANPFSLITLVDGFAVYRGAAFTNANVATVFHATRFLDASWTGCRLPLAQWLGVALRGCAFTDVDLVGAQLAGARFDDCSFTNVDARLADLRGATFHRCAFTDVNLQNARLEDVVFDDCRMTNVDTRQFGYRPA